ncbi:hypothetical protein HPB48_019391 [Haemaphysalis longicornis]|uniref:Purinergic receptor n=1 Tax=Haemaphysalis longicornis TaxID=44386 RepID=A0A9J6GRA2_HAELO|nr:hypothetical protein HPB48_019391 [Haemaphysalis longicornis]
MDSRAALDRRGFGMCPGPVGVFLRIQDAQGRPDREQEGRRAQQDHTARPNGIRHRVRRGAPESINSSFHLCHWSKQLFQGIQYALIYEKGYQRFGSCTSATTVKVKGALSTEHLSEGGLQPGAGREYPALPTSLGQRGHCCSSARVMTGRCVKAAHTSDDQHVCEISGWCPVEQDVQVLRNIPDKMDAHHLRSCVHDARKAPLCPIFRIGDMVEAAGSDFDQIAAKGGVIQIMISWDCDLDYDIKHCLPQYSFLRLDDPEATVAPGFNFR